MSIDLFYDAKEKHMHIQIPPDLETSDITQVVNMLRDHDFDTEFFYIDLGSVHNLNNTSLSLIYFIAGYAEKELKDVQLVDCNPLIKEVLDECNIFKNVLY